MAVVGCLEMTNNMKSIPNCQKKILMQMSVKANGFSAFLLSASFDFLHKTAT